MSCDPRLRATRIRTVIKAAVSAEVAGQWIPQIVRPIRVGRLAGLLRIVAISR